MPITKRGYLTTSFLILIGEHAYGLRLCQKCPRLAPPIYAMTLEPPQEAEMLALSFPPRRFCRRADAPGV